MTKPLQDHEPQRPPPSPWPWLLVRAGVALVVFATAIQFSEDPKIALLLAVLVLAPGAYTKRVTGGG